ncbi:hypothetical protein CAEBREN_03025 [Caenorhabditis brenneri]|uniref:non-specific serine/threonine protein kinase n=1 Tax=Caenorhabditis brenneri TaxID=135651 RepID=G0N7I6_CAEBE|nr:hypothetical protein CAEBREN_03025 [Caenorhabditis brenneri]
MNIRDALEKIGQDNGNDFWTTNQEDTPPAETTSRRSSRKSTKSRKRSPSSGAAPSTSEPRKKARRKIELIITPPTKPRQLHFGEKGYYPVTDGQVLENRYELQKMLGNGSYATVHLAKDRQTQSAVAIKIVRTGELYNIASDLEIGFMKTAKRTISSSNDSESIVSLLDNFGLQGPHGLHVVMVMEALGPDLLSILCESNQKVLSVHRIKSFSKNILEGLHFLHSKCNILHLDLKPENLFVTVDPDNMDLSDPACSARLKIGDFGTSARTYETVKRIVQTSHYRAPESFFKVQISPVTDVWSVGCCIYEMVTRSMLFPSCNEPTDKSGHKWYLSKISELLGPIRMSYFERNERNEEIFKEVFGNRDVLHEKKGQFNWISPGELMREHPMKKTEAEEFNVFMKELMVINPKRRPSAEEALKRPFFTNDCSE